jgi:hypothetical protein
MTIKPLDEGKESITNGEKERYFTHFISFQDLNAILRSMTLSTNIERGFETLSKVKLLKEWELT